MPPFLCRSGQGGGGPARHVANRRPGRRRAIGSVFGSTQGGGGAVPKLFRPVRPERRMRRPSGRRRRAAACPIGSGRRRSRSKTLGRSGPNGVAASPGRRRGKPPVRQAQGGGGALRAIWSRLLRFKGRRHQGGGRCRRFLHKAPREEERGLAKKLTCRRRLPSPRG